MKSELIYEGPVTLFDLAQAYKTHTNSCFGPPTKILLNKEGRDEYIKILTPTVRKYVKKKGLFYRGVPIEIIKPSH